MCSSDLHAFFGKTAHLFGSQPAQYAHGVFAFDFEAGVGETLDEFAGGGQDEQAAGVDVQASDGDPAAAGGLRQAVEDADAALRVVAGNDFAFLFVIQDDARQAIRPFEFDDAAFDGNVVVGSDFVAQLHSFAVDGSIAESKLTTPTANRGTYKGIAGILVNTNDAGDTVTNRGNIEEDKSSVTNVRAYGAVVNKGTFVNYGNIKQIGRAHV